MIVPRTAPHVFAKCKFKITLHHDVWYCKKGKKLQYVQQVFLVRYKPMNKKPKLEHRISYGQNLTRSQAYAKAMRLIDEIKKTHNIADKDCLLCDINGVY